MVTLDAFAGMTIPLGTVEMKNPTASSGVSNDPKASPPNVLIVVRLCSPRP